MKGIILAGGSGTRLHPLTRVTSKQFLPVYDKPVIYYPLSVLMLIGIREVMIISTPRDLPVIQSALGDGNQLGLQLSYKKQEQPRGIADAFLLAEDFLQGQPSCLILGDNLFHGGDLILRLNEGKKSFKGAHIFAHIVKDPQRYGVVTFDKNYNVLNIEEKPKAPKSNWAVTGIYFYDKNVVSHVKQMKPSARGELEITDLNNVYLKNKSLSVTCFGRGICWLDVGTPDSLLEASSYVQTIENRQGLKIACLEEVAFWRGFINREQLRQLAKENPNSDYSRYLVYVADNVHPPQQS